MKKVHTINWHHPPRQKGSSLIVVLVMMLLSVLLALGTGRVSYISEIRAGNDTDYQRAFEAAQALVTDAEIDILLGGGKVWSAPPPAGTIGSLRPEMLRLNTKERDTMETVANAIDAVSGPVKCTNGICDDLGPAATNFWNNPTTLSDYMAAGVGARYGQFTNRGTLRNKDNSNPYLAPEGIADPPRARYWIEVLRAGISDTPWVNECLKANTDQNDLFRITAVVIGRNGKPAVVQEYFVDRPNLNDGPRRCPQGA